MKFKKTFLISRPKLVNERIFPMAHTFEPTCRVSHLSDEVSRVKKLKTPVFPLEFLCQSPSES